MPKRLTKENFINRAIKIHGNKYDYSKVEYINNRTKVCIICAEHGEFWISPDNILSGKGCKRCGIISAQNKNNLSNTWRILAKTTSPSKKNGIEYQGKQHFKPIMHFGGETEFKKTYKRDLKNIINQKKME